MLALRKVPFGYAHDHRRYAYLFFDLGDLKLAQKDEMDKEKLQSQEDQADLRAEVTLAGQRGRNAQN